jgi:hypothetical protein
MCNQCNIWTTSKTSKQMAVVMHASSESSMSHKLEDRDSFSESQFGLTGHFVGQADWGYLFIAWAPKRNIHHLSRHKEHMPHPLFRIWYKPPTWDKEKQGKKNRERKKRHSPLPHHQQRLGYCICRGILYVWPQFTYSKLRQFHRDFWWANQPILWLRWLVYWVN